MADCPSISGWLYKMKPNLNSAWDRRHFRLENTKLCYYKDAKTSKRKGVIALKIVSGVQRQKFAKTPKPHHSQCGFEIITPERSYCLVAESSEEAEEWVAVLNGALDYWRQRSWDVDGGDASGGESDDSITSMRSELSRTAMGGSVSASQLSANSPPKGTPPRHSMLLDIKTEHGDDFGKTADALSPQDAFVVVDGDEAEREVKANDDSADLSLDTTKLTIFMGAGPSKVLSVPRSATTDEIITMLVSKNQSDALNRSFLDTISLWEVSSSASCHKLESTERPCENRKFGSRIYLVTRGRRLFIIHFEFGRFVPVVFPLNATARAVCEPTEDMEDLVEVIVNVRSPRLFVVDSNNSEKIVGEDELLSEVLPPESASRLMVRPCAPVMAVTSSDADVQHPTVRSWLQKKGNVNHNWQKRFCVFSDGLLRYYATSADSAPKGTIALAEMQEVKEVSDESHKFPHGFHIVTPTREYAFSGETPQVQQEWVRALKIAIATQQHKRTARKCGFLDKRGHLNTAWRKRWFVLTSDALEYADGPEKYENRAGVSSIRLSDVNATSGEGLTFQLVGLEGDRTYHLRAESADDKEDWLCALQGRERDEDRPAPITIVSATKRPRSPARSPAVVRRAPSPQNAPKQVYQQQSGGASHRGQEPVRPKPLPAPLFTPDESVCDNFSTTPKLPLFARGTEELPPSLQEEMDRPDALAKVFDEFPSLVPVKPRESVDSTLLSPKAAELAARKAPGVPLSSDALRKTMDTAAIRLPGHALPIEVPSPATLRTLILQPTDPGPGQAAGGVCVRLSGVALQQRGGRWVLMQGQKFHPMLPEMSDRVEAIPLPPDIVALYDHGQRRWFVVPSGALRPVRVGPNSGDSNDDDIHPDPTTNAFLRAGGRRQIAQVLNAAEAIVEFHSGHLSNAEALDDSINPKIGSLVRGPLCTSIAQMLGNGMNPFRLGGLVRNTLWTVVVASCPAVGPSTSPAGQAAYRVINDINSEQLMSSDPNMKFRTFICASLNHKFLEDWLREFFNNMQLLAKFYQPTAFVRCCPPALLEDLLLGLQPLLMLPLRLHVGFELKGRPGIRRTQSFADPTGSSLPRRATAAYNHRSPQSTQQYPATHHYQGQHQVNPSRQADNRHDPYAEVPGSLPSAFVENYEERVEVTAYGGRADYQHEQQSDQYEDEPAAEEAFEEGALVKAMYDNETDEANELSFTAEDIMQVERVVSADWLFCDRFGEKGLVPTSFVQRM